jgi:CubicO group peptidase (beta-lactamase class C family)
MKTQERHGRTRWCIIWAAAIPLILALALATPEVRSAKAQSPAPLDPARLGKFFDGLFDTQREAYHVPGATVAVVQNGTLIFAKGYGYADVEQRTPVVADKTLFRVASISKLFVWTAVMQLVEQGKLDLDADVNTYLKDFKIPPTYPQPITLAHLMTHTPGFEDRALGTSVRSAADLQPFGEFLATHMPARVRPPGELTAYSNYGAALAGYIVSQVSGMPFEQYVETRILQPLAMQHSSFRQPLPANLVPDTAVGYTYTNGAFQPHTFEWLQLAPAAALSATATDMANFMIAQLQDGQFGDTRILQAATARAMHQQSFRNDPRVNGFAHGFAVATLNGQQLLWHGGDIMHFHSALVLLPAHNVGLFVAYNGANGMPAVLNTLRAFLDTFYPAPHPAPAAPALAGDATRFAGTYLPARREYTTLGKIVGLLSSITVAPADTHRLVVSLGFPAQLTGRYTEVAPGVFCSADVPPSVFGDLVFRTDSQEQTIELFQENNPTTAYIKAPWYATPDVNLILLCMCIVLFLSVLIWAPIGLWIARRFHTSQPTPARLAAWAAGLLSVFSLGFLIGFSMLFSNPETILGLPAWAQLLFLAPWVIAGLAIAMVVCTVAAWARGYWSLPGRIHYTLVTLAALTFVTWLAYWNLWRIVT